MRDANMESLEWLTLQGVKARRKTILSHYDKYVEYIDDYKQMKEAQENNKRIMDTVKKIDKIIKQMEDVEQELKNRGIDAELRYSKCRMRIIYGDKILFKNIEL